MPNFLYPTVAEAIETHRQGIAEWGGALGIRDLGLLEAAIFRPQIGYYDDLAHEAAALMESLASNHPFIDGNKRACFLITDAFLRFNGFYLDVEPIAAHRFITESIAKRTFRIGQIRDWIVSNLEKLSED